MKAFPEGTYNGPLPKGCMLCAKGAKLVLFMNGICLEDCYYCPLSKKRKGSWDTWANERRITNKDEIIDEAYKSGAMGTGITGGDPIMVLDDTITYATLLKDTFKDHHIHLYTSGTLVNKMVLGYLENVIDEIRFHPKKENWGKLDLALAYDLDVGAEIPVIPDKKGEILEFAAYLDNIGVKFLNINELEYSETNAPALRKRGMKFSDNSNSVLGSEEIALEVIKETQDLDLSVHYCSSRFKDGVQLRERLKRRANNVKAKYEDVDEDGLIVRGEIEAFTLSKRDQVIASINEYFERDDDMVEVCGTKVLTSWAATEELKDVLEDKDLEFSIVKEYPIHDRILVEKEIL
ncbi:MAG: 4Fe-4S cluster-binding domain-containing protein [Candidatus Methanofastidiosia archaeon]